MIPPEKMSSEKFVFFLFPRFMSVPEIEWVRSVGLSVSICKENMFMMISPIIENKGRNSQLERLFF